MKHVMALVGRMDIQDILSDTEKTQNVKCSQQFRMLIRIEIHINLLQINYKTKSLRGHLVNLP